MRHLIGRLAVALLLVVCTLQCTSSSAQTNTTVRIGYANLALIKAKQKSWLDYSLRQTPDSDLRTAFEKCSKQVQWEVKRDHGFSQTPQMGGTWEGKPLILSLPATDSRPMSQDKFAEFGPSFAASGKAPAAAKPQTPARPAVAH